MKPFVEERLDMGIDYGADGGPSFDTEVVELSSGSEHRNANWENARGRWELGQRTVDRDEKDYLQAFFRARRGRAVGFRYKDWNDYRATDVPLVPDGTPTVQLRKIYESDTAGEREVREIKKPVAGTIQVTLNGSNVSHESVDESTGILTLSPTYEREIDTVSASQPTQIATVTEHGLSTGDERWIAGTGRSIDDQLWTVTVIDSFNFTLDGSDTSDELSAGTGWVRQYPGIADTVTWSGEFDTPARFETDRFRANFEAFDVDSEDGHWVLASLPVVEIRV